MDLDLRDPMQTGGHLETCRFRHFDGLATAHVGIKRSFHDFGSVVRYVKLGLMVDWLYIWAYHRIADRRGRRADDVSEQLAGLVSQRWEERPPGRGSGIWEGSAWATYAAWQRVGIKQPRNFFAPGKNLVRKLAAAADDTVLIAELERDFAGVFARAGEDVDALRVLGGSLDNLAYRGPVLIGWGVPRQVAWIGCVDDPHEWDGTPEERALRLFLPVKRFQPEPATSLLAERPSTPVWSKYRTWSPWRRAVADNLLALCRGHLPKPILVLPSREDLQVARLRQLRGDVRAITVIDETVVDEAARYFPWLWEAPLAAYTDPPLNVRFPPDLYLQRGEDFDELVRAVIVKSVVHDRLSVLMPKADLNACYEFVFGRPCEYFRSARAFHRFTALHINPLVCRYHKELTAILYRISAWVIDHGDEHAIESIASLWRGVNDTYARQIEECKLRLPAE